jgi:hypothetical protein
VAVNKEQGANSDDKPPRKVNDQKHKGGAGSKCPHRRSPASGASSDHVADGEHDSADGESDSEQDKRVARVEVWGWSVSPDPPRHQHQRRSVGAFPAMIPAMMMSLSVVCC